MKLICLKKELATTNEHGAITVWDVYSCFMKPRDIYNYSFTPNFQTDTTNTVLAAEIQTPSHKLWQRPVDTDIVSRIAANFTIQNIHNNFLTLKDLLVNPVILAQNPNYDQSERNGKINSPHGTGFREGEIWLKNQEQMDNLNSLGVSGQLSVLDIDYDSGTEQTAEDRAYRPLIIIDGQHRIQGLSNIEDPNVQLPVILIFGRNYNAATYAKIFAQVTTGAEPLKELHNEWLKYTYRLGDYREQSWIDSFKTVITLATTSYNVNNVVIQNNNKVFVNENNNDCKILFNDYLTLSGQSAFEYKCTELNKLLHDNYFGQNLGSVEKLSKHISLATTALNKMLLESNIPDSVFFGNRSLSILGESFLVGIIKHFESLQSIVQAGNNLNIDNYLDAFHTGQTIADHPTAIQNDIFLLNSVDFPTTHINSLFADNASNDLIYLYYYTLLCKLNFKNSTWNRDDWDIFDLSGNINDSSKKMSIKFFEKIFSLNINNGNIEFNFIPVYDILHLYRGTRFKYYLKIIVSFQDHNGNQIGGNAEFFGQIEEIQLNQNNNLSDIRIANAANQQVDYTTNGMLNEIQLTLPNNCNRFTVRLSPSLFDPSDPNRKGYPLPVKYLYDQNIQGQDNLFKTFNRKNIDSDSVNITADGYCTVAVRFDLFSSFYREIRINFTTI